MEYEISDDPQGETDRLDGHRNGGLHEDGLMLRQRGPVQPGDYLVDQDEDDFVD